MKVEIFHSIMGEGMDRFFELVTKTKKSSEPSWMSSYIRNLIKKRRKIFRRQGRTEKWKQLKRKTESLIKERRDCFNAHTREKFLASKSSKDFHRGIKAFLSTEQGVPWDPRDMFESCNVFQ